MRRAIAAALIASTLLGGLSMARASEKASAEGEAESGGRTMDAPYLAVPVVRDGRLRNYLFVSVRFNISPGVDLWQTREKAAFLRDALVRASHAHALADAHDPNQLDRGRAIALYNDVARQVLGANAVQSVAILSSYSSRGGPPSEPPRAAAPARAPASSHGGGH